MVKLLKLSVSGSKYELIEKDRLVAGSEGRLERFLSASSSHNDRLDLVTVYLPDTDTYFIDRSASLFESFLDFTLNPRFGLHVPGNVCLEQFQTELNYWNVGQHQVAPCCARRLGLIDSENIPNGGVSTATSSYALVAVDSVDDPYPKKPEEVATILVPLVASSVENLKSLADSTKDDFTGICIGDFRRKLWHTIDDPAYSQPARIFGGISILFIVLSVFSLILASLPECQTSDGEPHIILEVIEYVCIGWFTVEFVMRFMVAPKKCQFLRGPMEVVDCLSIFPFYLELSLKWAGVEFSDMDNVRGALMVMRLLRVLRVARIFKLARYSVAMKSCGRTLRESRREVGMLVIFVSIMIILFSTTVYFMEKDYPGTKFTSVPTSFWWCVVTITTVGYGDMTPKTTGGRLMASLASVAGVVVLAFPITVIVENFYRFYRKEKQEANELEAKNELYRSRLDRHNMV